MSPQQEQSSESEEVRESSGFENIEDPQVQQILMPEAHPLADQATVRSPVKQQRILPTDNVLDISVNSQN